MLFSSRTVYNFQQPHVLPMRWALLLHGVNFAEEKNLQEKSQRYRLYKFQEHVLQYQLRVNYCPGRRNMLL